ncbi:MAG: hydroxysqualene dehydroxylase HpnE [Granulicella sp.]
MSSGSDVVVVGGGLAGMAAATALASDGARVTLLERRPEIGGRVYSYPHPALEEIVDSQHVVLGCCTNLLDLCAQAGSGASIRWYDEMTFLEPGGRRSVMHPGVLPSPFHQTISFLRAPMLSLQDKVGIASGLMQFLRGYPSDDAESFAAWIKRTKQTERAIRHFWEPVVAGALNDGFENCSTKYAGKVFHESFLRSPEGGRLGIPAVPLSEFLAPVGEFARANGVLVRQKSGVEHIEQTGDVRWRVMTDGEDVYADSVVLAVNFKEAQRLMEQLPGVVEADSSHFISAPITTIHLWYDRDVTGVDHAVLLDTRIQWVFTKSRIRGWAEERGSYLELVISASWAELGMGRQEILESALRELELFFPKVKDATLRKSGVLKEARATFSITPGLDRYRPAQQTQWPGLYLAGDWTATEWPSTMEGAVRSGRMAAGAIGGDRMRYLSAETPATGLMRWLSRLSV